MIKRFLASALALISFAAIGATLSPVQLLNPAGSTAGQAIVSNGPIAAPTWQAVPLTGVTGVLPIANGGTNANTAPTALSNLGGAALTGATFTGNITASGATFIVDGAAASGKSILWKTSAFQRWELKVGDTESGSNTGSNMYLARFSDAGSFIDFPLSIARSTGVTTFAGAVTPSQTAGLVGTTTNNNANAGAWGEYNEAAGTGVAMTTATSTNIASVNLGAGDWHVFGNIVCTAGAGDTITNLTSGFSTASATLPAGTNRALSGIISVAAGTSGSSQPPEQRLLLAGSTTVYLVGNITHSGGTAACDGHLRYWRRR